MGHYSSLDDAGKFNIYAGLDMLPNTWDRYEAYDMGAFRRLLKLPPPEKPTSKYYIIVEGQNGTKIDLGITEDSKTPTLNSRWFDVIINDEVYQTEIKLKKMPTEPLTVMLKAIEGHGLFNISYCNGQSFYTFENIDGANG